MSELVLLLACGMLAGTLSGLLGVGGGIFMVPLLILLGRSQHVAQATSLLVVLPSAIVATASLRRAGIGDMRAGLRIGVAGIAGAAAGSTLALALPGPALRIAFVALLAMVGVRLLRDAWRMAPPAASRCDRR